MVTGRRIAIVRRAADGDRPSYGDRPGGMGTVRRTTTARAGMGIARPMAIDPRATVTGLPTTTARVADGDRDRDRPAYNDRPRRDGDRPSYGDRPHAMEIGRRTAIVRRGLTVTGRPTAIGLGGTVIVRRTTTARAGMDDRPAYGDRPRTGGDRPGPTVIDRARDGDRPAYGDRPPRTDGDRPSYGDRPRRDSDRPSYGDRPRTGGDRPSYGDRPRTGGTDRPTVTGRRATVTGRRTATVRSDRW